MDCKHENPRLIDKGFYGCWCENCGAFKKSLIVHSEWELPRIHKKEHPGLVALRKIIKLIERPPEKPEKEKENARD